MGGPDNYAEFLARLDAAKANLIAHARAVDKSVSAVSLLLETYQAALKRWEQRRARVNKELTEYAEEPQTYAALGELKDTAAKMEALHRAHALRIAEKLSVLHARRDAIGRSLVELEDSRSTLNSSRRMSRDRENLNKILYELAGPSGAAVPSPGPGLGNDLKEARDAVILAEALMEVKGF
jgi:chromosome segregation ATPase